MEIRLINKNDDRFAISNVYEESWKSAYKNIIPEDYLQNIPKGNWNKFFDLPDIYSLIMLDGDKIVGTSSYCCSRFLDMKDYGEIISIYLLPEYTKKGYGKLLLQKAIDGIKGLGFSNVFLWVLEENTNARNFYEKFGFLPQDKYLKDNIGGKELKEMLYTILYQDK